MIRKNKLFFGIFTKFFLARYIIWLKTIHRRIMCLLEEKKNHYMINVTTSSEITKKK